MQDTIHCRPIGAQVAGMGVEGRGRVEADPVDVKRNAWRQAALTGGNLATHK